MYRYVAILEIVDWKAKIVNKSIKETQLETGLYCGCAMQGPYHGFEIYQWNKLQLSTAFIKKFCQELKEMCLEKINFELQKEPCKL